MSPVASRRTSGREPAGAVRPRTIDVRAIVAQGGNPFEQIMAVVGTLVAGEGLVLLTPFLPSPLIERLQAEGFHARPERRADGSWQTHFSRE